MNTTLTRCPECGRPCPDGLPYCSVACHCRAEESPVYLCTICHKNSVDAEDGYDTCTDCLSRQ
jgi:hypothetical protein